MIELGYAIITGICRSIVLCFIMLHGCRAFYKLKICGHLHCQVMVSIFLTIKHFLKIKACTLGFLRHNAITHLIDYSIG